MASPGSVEAEVKLAVESAACLVAKPVAGSTAAPAGLPSVQAMAMAESEFFPEPAAELAPRVWLAPTSTGARSGLQSNGSTLADARKESRPRPPRARRRKR